MPVLVLAVAVCAALFAAVGHGGASAYIALMALAGLGPETIRPTALMLNVLAAGIAAFQFVRAQQFEKRLFVLLASAGVPSAFLAAKIDLPRHMFEPLVAAALLAAAMRYLIWPNLDSYREVRRPPVALVLGAGGSLGALAGLTGIGGGVYLSPLLIFSGWTRPKQAAGVAAAFIVANSVAGLISRPDLIGDRPDFFALMAGGAIVGAVIGTSLSVSGFSQTLMVRVLGVVLFMAAGALLI